MSWLADYLEYTKHQESPELFHMWVGMTTLASVLARKVWIDRRSHGVTYYQVFPGQMMTVLVAPSGKGHKNTAIRLGRKLMQHAGVKIIKGKGSSEKIINLVANGAGPSVIAGHISTKPPDAVATIIAPELSVFLSKQTYSDALVDFLTDIYDAEEKFEYMTMAHNVITLHNPCVTMLAGATPVSIGKSIPEKAHDSGYLGRVLHVYHSGVERPTNPLTDLDDTDVSQDELDRIKSIEKSLKDRLDQIKLLRGSFTYTKQARDWLNDWTAAWFKSPVGQGEGWATRRPDHMLRTAMALHVSEHMSVGAIEWNVLQAADLAIGQIEQNFHLAFACIGQAQSAAHQDRVLDCLRRAGGRINTDMLVAKVHRFMTMDDLKSALEILRKAKEIVYLGTQNNVEWWRLP